MSATPLKFQSGDTLSIRDDGGTIALWGVVERKRGGWLLKPHSGADPRTWSDDEIHDAYSARQVTHFPCNTANLPKQVNEVIERTWEYWPQAARREAERRILYVRMVDTIKNHHFTLMDAFKAAAEEVYEANWERWHQEDIEDSARRAIEEKQKKQTHARAAEITLPAVPKPRRYSPYAVRDWYLRWNSLGHDIRILLPHFHLRGRFGPRKNTERGDRPDAYKLMRVAINQFYMTMPRKLKKYAYRKYVELCEAAHIEPLSDGAFRKFINSSYTERQEFEKRYGKRAAYLKFGIFERTKPPERPLEEIEVDHCLIDLIVVHPITKRPMGRPWLTVLIDRATRVILGAHLSFEVPSYAALQRAIAHSIWPKDLCGIEGLEHDWPCHGVFEWLICDNGKEFRSKSLLLSASMLDFHVVNLPVKQPWLKGMVERLFGRIGVQVFSHLEGSTLSRTKDFYDPVERAQYSLSEISFMLLKWIVDEYHETKHDTLGCKPIEKWRELTERYPVRPVPNFDHIIRLTGEVIDRQISNVGIHWEGLLYADKKKLEPLLARRGGLQKIWRILLDPYDVGEVWILDDETGEWLVVPCTDQAISRGVSKHQHLVHKKIAQNSIPKGAHVTTADLVRAKAVAEQEAADLFNEGTKTSTAAKAARYATSGAYFTPLASAGFSSALTPTSPVLKGAAIEIRSPDSSAIRRESESISAPLAADIEDDIEAMVKLWDKANT
jgi:putative transposase